MTLEGTVIQYGDNVDTDVIIPARYLNTADPATLAAHCMEDIDKTFIHRVTPSTVMVAGQNFGCGSSREHAPIAIKASGVSCVVAKSFARIFYRNAINIGLPILECPDAVEDCAEADVLSIDLNSGVVQNLTQNKTYSAEPFPTFIQKIITAGGLVNAIQAGALE